MLMGPLGARFLRDAQEARRPVFAWTVNERERMRWCIRNGLEGVITDDPKAFLEECEMYERNLSSSDRLSLSVLADVVKVHLMAFLFGFLFSWRHGSS